MQGLLAMPVGNANAHGVLGPIMQRLLAMARMLGLLQPLSPPPER